MSVAKAGMPATASPAAETAAPTEQPPSVDDAGRGSAPSSATANRAGLPVTAGRQAEPALEQAVRRYLPLFSVLGVVLYGILRLAYVFFYLQLRTTPEEVGYGYSRVLSESVVGALELTLIVSIVFAVPALAVYGTRAVTGRRPAAAGGSRDRLQAVRRLFLRCVVAAAAVVLLSLPALAWWQGGLAREGQAIRNVYFIGIPYLPVLAVQAVPVRVSWVDSGSNRQLDLSKRNCLMYLGQGDGTTVFYDVRSHESLRLPSSDIVVLLRYTYFTPTGCR
jgi:hypothetical protein